MLNIYAAVAESQYRTMSRERTKAALAEAKARRVKLGQSSRHEGELK